MKMITIAGNITRDAATRNAGETSATSFSVAVDDGWGDKKRTLYFDCTIWGGRGEKLKQYLTKGGKVAVSGDLSTRDYEGKTYLTVKVAELTLQGGKPAAGGYDQSPMGAKGGAFDPPEGSDIPF